MTDTERRIILHCLGLTPRGTKMPRWSHRNYYCATDGGQDAKTFDAMESKGLVYQYAKPRDGYRWYRASAQGIVMAGVGNRVRNEDIHA